MATPRKDNIIEILRPKITYNRDDLTREDQTRTVLIDPLLYALGWDVSNPRQVRTESRLNVGGRPDYVMHDSRSKRPFMVVEAKRLQTTLSGLTGFGHQSQLLGYMRELGCPLGVVTNGDDWQIYRADSFARLTPIKTLSVSRNTISDFALIAAQDQRDAVNYRQKSEQWLRDERERKRAADRELDSSERQPDEPWCSSRPGICRWLAAWCCPGLPPPSEPGKKDPVQHERFMKQQPSAT